MRRLIIPIRAAGDLKERLEANPDAPRAKLERYIVVEYDASSDMEKAISALQSDSNIEAVSVPIEITLSSLKLGGQQKKRFQRVDPNYGWLTTNIAGAWDWVGGHAFVGVVDVGLAVDHPELRAFTDSGSFTRGNFLTAFSRDVGRWPEGIGSNVDELELELVENPDPSCPTDVDGKASVDFAGHGTSVSGLIASNPYVGHVDGACKHCGIGMWRSAYAVCSPGVGVVPALNADGTAAAITLLADSGSQVINMSWGFDPQQTDYCASFPENAFCLAYAYINSRDIALVGASGNQRTWLQFPARDSRVVAAGGFDEQLQLWDESPGSTEDCPFGSGDGRECGSNWTTFTGGPKQELVSAARSVYGLMYPGMDWNPALSCGDNFGPAGNDEGYGVCTGTSMSAPHIAGIIGLMRSVNPLVSVGSPEVIDEAGIRSVLAATTFQAQDDQPWSQELGYGRPDAELAVRAMLGTVSGQTVRNRATPLFSMYGSLPSDHAYSTSPQTAISFTINQNWEIPRLCRGDSRSLTF